MPNWVKNRISFNSKEDMLMAIEQLGRLEDYKDDKFSFTWAVPYPNTKEECLEKYGKEYITEDPEKDHIQKDEDKPWLNWYDFQRNFWGCKWDASEVYYGDSNIYFDSPWSPPCKFIEALAEKLPDIPFCFNYAEEQGNLHCGEFYHYKEKSIENDFWNEFKKCSEEASLMYNDLWCETYFKCEEDGCYHCDSDEGVFIDQENNLHYFDFTNLSEENKELAKSLHKSCKERFDEFIIDKYFIIDNYNEPDCCKYGIRIQDFEEFLKEAIGFYKPCWENEELDPGLYEVDHIYNYVSSFEEGEGYVESF